jgi:hypothetical protein
MKGMKGMREVSEGMSEHRERGCERKECGSRFVNEEKSE